MAGLSWVQEVVAIFTEGRHSKKSKFGELRWGIQFGAQSWR